MNKKKISFLFRLLVITSLFTGIVLNIYHSKHIIMILSYYTLQINIFCLIITVLFELADIMKIEYRNNNFYYFIKGEIIISVLLMIIVYVIALMPKKFQMYTIHTENNIANILVHIISPILVILDYILFDEKGKFKLYYPIIWISIPLAYVVYVYTYSLHGGVFYNIGGSKKYGYLFLDYEKYGYVKIGTCIMFIAITLVLIGYILIAIDKRLKLVIKK